jgi:hypothetical protein
MEALQILRKLEKSKSELPDSEIVRKLLRKGLIHLEDAHYHISDYGRGVLRGVETSAKIYLGNYLG